MGLIDGQVLKYFSCIQAMTNSEKLCLKALRKKKNEYLKGSTSSFSAPSLRQTLHRLPSLGSKFKQI